LDPRRDLTYVSDTVAGMVAAASAAEAVGRTVQLGTGRDVAVAQLVAMVGELLGCEFKVEEDPDRIRPPGSEVMRLVSSPALASALLDWAPQSRSRTGSAARSTG
jgi:nucleoside-diphosphate-sugar epimerase